MKHAPRLPFAPTTHRIGHGLLTGWLVVSLLVGCGGGGSDDPLPAVPNAPPTFLAAQQLWTRLALPAYRFTLATVCFCLPESAIEVTVRDGQVSSAVYVDTRASVSPARLLTLPTLTVLFDLGDDAYNRNAAQVTFTPNSRYGFLESIHIDYNVQMADEERSYLVSGFTVLTP